MNREVRSKDLDIIDPDKKIIALEGGIPVRATRLPYGLQYVNDEDIEAVTKVLRSDWITTGPKVKEFEEATARYVGAKYAVSFSSGTAALHGAAYAAKLGSGDEVITTPLTFCATANSALYVGAKPVFADVSEDTLNIDPKNIHQKITSRTKAIIPIDYAGHPAEIDKIMALAEEFELTVIEDASHAIGSEYKSKRIGGLSHMTVFSFHPVKHITTGEGGMVTTDNPEFANRLRKFRNHGINRDFENQPDKAEKQWYYEMDDLGFNYRLSDISCALGLSQLKRLPENISRRRDIVSKYNLEISKITGLTTPTERIDNRSAWHIYPLRFDLSKFKVGRTSIFRALRAENIHVNVHYVPVHLHPYYRTKFGFRGGEYPVAESNYERLITLPLFPAMTDQDVEDVLSAVNKICRHYT